MDESITYWLSQLKQGNSLAETEIWERYFKQLVALARRRLREARLREFDEEDIALSAFNSFYRAVDEQRLPRLDDRHDLWKVLVTITVRKISAQRKRDMALKRGKGQVRGESFFQRPDDNDPAGLAQVLGAEPTPEVAVMVTENYEQLIGQLPDEMSRRVAQLKMEGYSNVEIAGQLGCVERTVERRLERIRAAWEA